MNNFSFSIQILTLGSTKNELLATVDGVIELIKNSGLHYVVSPFETTVEGDYDSCMTLLNKCIQYAGNFYNDIFANIKIHYDKDKEILTINEKIQNHNR